MTRYDLFNKLRDLCVLEKTGEHSYNKMVQSGGLVETHWDYECGYYDVNVHYFKDYQDKHQCRIWFGTIDDGDFGSWNECETKEKAVELVEKAANIIKDINVCPPFNELNLLFRPIGIYLCNE